MSPEAIADGTGRSWEDWLTFFESIGASELTHREIVARAAESGAPEWWRQMVTVAYEQHIGRRLPGQRSDGTFAVSATRTRPGSLDTSLARWVEVNGEPTEVAGVAVTQGPEVTSSDGWRYWRLRLADGSRVVVNVSDKAPDRSVVAVQHEQLATPEAAEAWRAHWKQVLAGL
jgi:hypothetical protein